MVVAEHIKCKFLTIKNVRSCRQASVCVGRGGNGNALRKLTVLELVLDFYTPSFEKE